jgi:hypothetical protein
MMSYRVNNSAGWVEHLSLVLFPELIFLCFLNRNRKLRPALPIYDCALAKMAGMSSTVFLPSKMSYTAVNSG